MKTRISALLIIAAFAMSYYGCTNIDNGQGVICTEEFRATLINVPGDSLTEFYTIRLSNLETIHHARHPDLKANYYVVLDDNYQPKLENQQDTFQFIGKRGSEIVVREEYVFKADQCHITKVSGK